MVSHYHQGIFFPFWVIVVRKGGSIASRCFYLHNMKFNLDVHVCPNVLQYWKKIWLIKVANRKKPNETEKLKMQWQSPTFNVQFSWTIACMFNKNDKKRNKSTFHAQKKNRALQACFSKSELEKELATFIMCVLKYYAFHVLWCREPNTRVHGPCMKYFDAK